MPPTWPSPPSPAAENGPGDSVDLRIRGSFRFKIDIRGLLSSMGSVPSSATLLGLSTAALSAPSPAANPSGPIPLPEREASEGHGCDTRRMAALPPFPRLETGNDERDAAAGSTSGTVRERLRGRRHAPRPDRTRMGEYGGTLRWDVREFGLDVSMAWFDDADPTHCEADSG
jgi:hypothetical protein